MCYGGLGQSQQAVAAGVPPDIGRSGPGPGPSPDSVLSAAQASGSVPKLDTADNVEKLASIIKSEAEGCNRAEQIAVGSTVLNRMRRNGTALVGDVRGYSLDRKPDDAFRQIAQGILNGSIADNTGGATHFYSPGRMPREGGSTAGYDTGGGLESTAGLSSRNYRPSFAAQYEAKSVPGARGANFRFFSAPGNGPVR